MDTAFTYDTAALEQAVALLDHRRITILTLLLPGTKRFGVLRAELRGIAQKTLAANLRVLEGAGLVSRQVFAEVPPRVEYTLTEAGQRLRPVLDSLAQWSREALKDTRKED